MILAFTNQKGGVGKTTSALNTGVYLANLSKKVLLVDTDPQANLTSGIGYERSNQGTGSYELLTQKAPISKSFFSTKIDNLYIVPSSIDLAGAEVELVSAMNRERILSNALNEIKNDFDYILIDCPPSLGLLTLNSLTAADGVIIPVQCEYFALEGLGQLMNTIKLVKKNLNPSLSIEGVLLTMFDSRTNLSKEIVDEVKEFFKEKVFKTVVPRNVRLSEAPSHGDPISVYDPKSPGAVAYEALAKEIIKSK